MSETHEHTHDISEMITSAPVITGVSQITSMLAVQDVYTVRIALKNSPTGFSDAQVKYVSADNRQVAAELGAERAAEVAEGSLHAAVALHGYQVDLGDMQKELGEQVLDETSRQALSETLFEFVYGNPQQPYDGRRLMKRVSAAESTAYQELDGAKIASVYAIKGLKEAVRRRDDADATRDTIRHLAKRGIAVVSLGFTLFGGLAGVGVAHLVTSQTIDSERVEGASPSVIEATREGEPVFDELSGGAGLLAGVVCGVGLGLINRPELAKFRAKRIVKNAKETR